MEISECTVADIPALMVFIGEHWRQDHILARERRVLDWYYGCPQGCNFLLARRDGEIFAVLGFIDVDHLNAKRSVNSELWLALWKVRDDAGVPALGLRLIMELKKRYPQRPIAVLGLSEAARKIYRLLGYEVKTLDQLFIHNRNLHKHRLLRGTLPDYRCPPFAGSVEPVSHKERLFADANQIEDCRGRSASYFIHRYLDNPFSNYQLYRIFLEGQIAYAVGRVMSANGGRTLRLVDLYGQLPLLGAALVWFERYLQQQELEFMDLYLYSEQNSLLQECGFINRAGCADDVVVPNYFQPFVALNIDLQCAMENGFTGPVFKADGDQERPNWVN